MQHRMLSNFQRLNAKIQFHKKFQINFNFYISLNKSIILMIFLLKFE